MSHSCEKNLPADVAVARAEQLCAGRGARFTDLRRQVFALVWQAEQPVGAYDLLQQMSDGVRQAKPPTIYRALDFLLEQGLVHRIASNNTFVACLHPGERHASVFLVCRNCGRASEQDSEAIASAVEGLAAQFGFKVEQAVMELAGVCELCRGHRHA